MKPELVEIPVYQLRIKNFGGNAKLTSVLNLSQRPYKVHRSVSDTRRHDRRRLLLRSNSQISYSGNDFSVPKVEHLVYVDFNCKKIF